MDGAWPLIQGRAAAMLLFNIARMVLALAATLGLIGLIAVGLRRFGPQTLRRLQGMQTSRVERRLAVVETLVLDPARRLVLVRFDAEERLILLGEGRVIAQRPPAPARPSPFASDGA